MVLRNLSDNANICDGLQIFWRLVARSLLHIPIPRLSPVILTLTLKLTFTLILTLTSAPALDTILGFLEAGVASEGAAQDEQE